MHRTLLVLLASFGTLDFQPLHAEEKTYDLLIRDARIIDGGGSSSFRGDIGVNGAQIAAVGSLQGSRARRTIDAAGRVVAPGFIDMMGQDSFILVKDRAAAESHLRQGITTIYSGEGWSVAPRDDKAQGAAMLYGNHELKWRTFAEYFRILEERRIALNVVHNVGAGQVRSVVIGDENRAATPAELERMEQLVDEAMRDGAVGISAALIYPPGSYATTEELIALSKVAARHGGFYAAHMRSEGDQLLASIDETLRIGREAGLPVHVFHLKAGGTANWPRMADAIARLDDARRRGQDVTADIYPYVRSGTYLSAFIAPQNFSAGLPALSKSLADPGVRARLRREIEETDGWENIYRSLGSDWSKVLITSAPGYPDRNVVGLSVAEAAQRTGKDVWTLVFDLVQAGEAHIAPQSMNEEQKVLGLRWPWMMVDTDTSPTNPATASGGHPRAFGAFPRVLAKYVREDRVLTLEEAIRRMTSLAATRLGLQDRGRIAPGLAADLVMFDPARIADRATYTEPLQLAVGVDYLLVNGTPVIDDNRLTGTLPGKVLRHRSRD